LIFLKYYEEDEIKEKDIGWECGRQDREMKIILKVLMRNFEMKIKHKMKKIFGCIFRK
jgi:hypothetical protein